MNICIISDTLSSMGGSEYSVVITAKYLSSLNYKVSVVAYCVYGPPHAMWLGVLEEAGIEVYILDSISGNSHVNIVSAMKLISILKPDIVYSIPIESLGTMITRVKSFIPSVKLIGTLTSDPIPTNYWYEEISVDNLNLYDLIVCPAEIIKKNYIRFISKQVPLEVIPHIIPDACPPNLSKYWSLDQSDDPKLTNFGAITRLREEKGTDFLISAFAMISDSIPGSTLTIYGDMQELERSKNVAKALGVNKNIIWYGEFDGVRDIDDIIYNHTIFLLSSLFESMPISLMEILSRGRLPIATNVGAISELFTKVGFGLTTPVGDPRAMADIAISLIKSGEPSMFCNVETRKKFHEYYSIKFTLNHLAELLNQL